MGGSRCCVCCTQAVRPRLGSSGPFDDSFSFSDGIPIGHRRDTGQPALAELAELGPAGSNDRLTDRQVAMALGRQGGDSWSARFSHNSIDHMVQRINSARPKFIGSTGTLVEVRDGSLAQRLAQPGSLAATYSSFPHPFRSCHPPLFLCPLLFFRSRLTVSCGVHREQRHLGDASHMPPLSCLQQK